MFTVTFRHPKVPTPVVRKCDSIVEAAHEAARLINLACEDAGIPATATADNYMLVLARLQSVIDGISLAMSSDLHQ
jgi:hypothetical protein